LTAAVGAGLGIGAGVGVSSVALAPFNAANTFMGSAFFGYGMILGERYMYQADWPKIQARLEHGEKIENIIQEYTGVFTAVVMKEAKIIFDTVTQEFIEIMKQALFAVPPSPEATAATRETAARRGRTTTKQPPTPTPPQPVIPTTGGVKIPPVEVPQPKTISADQMRQYKQSFDKVNWFTALKKAFPNESNLWATGMSLWPRTLNLWVKLFPQHFDEAKKGAWYPTPAQVKAKRYVGR